MTDTRTIKVVQNLTVGNDLIARDNRRRFEAAGALAVNLVASPGAGKTSLILKTMAALKGRPLKGRAPAGEAAVGVIEGDVAGQLDTERVLAAGARDAVQINTGGNCHLEAGMVQQALSNLALEALDVVFIENVGNLICPNHWALGEHAKVCLASVAEGDDKPIKYPEVFAASDAVVLNKLDLIERVEFDRARFDRALQSLNPRAPLFALSCRTGDGLDAWVAWLLARWAEVRPAAGAP